MTRVAAWVVWRASPFVVTAALWWVLADREVLGNAFVLPPPADVIDRLRQLLVAGTFGEDVLFTVRSILGAFALALVVGVAAGVLIGRSGIRRRVLGPVVVVTFPIPKVALYPAMTILFGLGAASKVAFGFTEAVFPILIATAAGTAAVEPTMVWSARALGAWRRHALGGVVLPAALPSILTGARIGIVGATVGVFLGEMIVGAHGLGHLMAVAYRTLDTPDVYVAVVTISVIGFVLDRTVLVARRRLLSWNPEGSREHHRPTPRSRRRRRRAVAARGESRRRHPRRSTPPRRCRARPAGRRHQSHGAARRARRPGGAEVCGDRRHRTPRRRRREHGVVRHHRWRQQHLRRLPAARRRRRGLRRSRSQQRHDVHAARHAHGAARRNAASDRALAVRQQLPARRVDRPRRQAAARRRRDGPGAAPGLRPRSRHRDRRHLAHRRHAGDREPPRHRHRSRHRAGALLRVRRCPVAGRPAVADAGVQHHPADARSRPGRHRPRRPRRGRPSGSRQSRRHPPR